MPRIIYIYRQNILCVESEGKASDGSTIKIILNLSISKKIYQICMIMETSL